MTTQADTYYIITGVDVHGKRFRKTSENLWYLENHNVWRGTLWRASRGKPGRKRLKRWWN